MNATEARQRSLDNQYENAMKEIDKSSSWRMDKM